MKPDIKLLLQQAQRPKAHFVPARAGWNGPEDKTAIIDPNPAYDELRRGPSPLEMRASFLAAAIPDWRAVLAIFGVIFGLRALLRRTGKEQLGPVYVFPASAGRQTAPESEAA